MQKESRGVNKGNIFENLGKNVQNLKIFSKKARDCMQLMHAINCLNMPLLMEQTVFLLGFINAGRLWLQMSVQDTNPPEVRGSG